MKTVLAVLIAVFLVGCSRATPPAPAPSSRGHNDAPGSGEHKIVGISILVKGHNDLDRGKNPSTLKVGQTLPLEVWASWAIPYAEDVTGRVTLTVSNPALGALDGHAIFTALKPGKVAVEAVLAPNAISGDASGAGFKDKLELTIVE
jgi:hypothetical protein